MSFAPAFDAEFRARLRVLLAWRRDVRRFRCDPLPEGAVERLLELACLAPSVGLSQPWRFVLVNDPSRRAEVRRVFAACNAEALADQTPERAAQYARLKLAGLDDAPCHIAVFADRETTQGVWVLEVYRSAAGRRSDERGLSHIRHFAQDRLQDLRALQGTRS